MKKLILFTTLLSFNLPINIFNIGTNCTNLLSNQALAEQIPENNIKKGEELFSLHTKKAYIEAISYFDKELQSNKKNPLVLAYKAKIQAYLAYYLKINSLPSGNLLSDSENNANEALKLNPNLPVVHLAFSAINRVNEEFEEGQAEAQRAIDLEPNNPEGFFLKWVNDEGQNYNNKMVYLDTGISVSGSNIPDDIKTFNSLLIKKILKLKPDMAIAHYELGNANLSNGNFDKAINEFNEAIRINPDFTLAYINLGIIFSQDREVSDDSSSYGDTHSPEKLNNAFKFLIKAIELEPDSVWGHYFLGNVYKNKEKFEEAIKEYQEVLKYNSKFNVSKRLGETYYLYGNFLLKTNANKALEHYNESLKYDPNFFLTYNKISNILTSQRRFDDLINISNKYLTIFPENNYFALFSLAKAYAIKNNKKESLKYLKRAFSIEKSLIKKTKNNPQFKNLRNEKEFQNLFIGVNDVISEEEFLEEEFFENILAEGKNLKDPIEGNKIIEKLTEYINENPASKNSFLFRSGLYYQQKMYEPSIKDLKKVLEIDPLNQKANASLKVILKEFGLKLLNEGNKEGELLIKEAEVAENNYKTIDSIKKAKIFYKNQEPNNAIKILNSINKPSHLKDIINELLMFSYVNIGANLMENEKYNEAKNSLEKAQEVSFLLKNKTKESIEMEKYLFECLEALYPAIIAQLLENKKYKESIIVANKLLKIAPLNSNAYVLKGGAEFLFGNKKEGIKLNFKAIEINPKNSLAYYSLAGIYSLAKNENEAIKYLRRSIDLNKDLKNEAKKESDFNNIRKNKEFQKLIK